MDQRRRDLDDLQQLAMPQLIARYEQVFGKPPRVKHRAFLAKRIAWKLEEQRTGGLSKKARARLEELIAKLDIDLGDRKVNGTITPRRPAEELAVGTTLTRVWRDRRLIVYVVDGGFEHEGETHKSLSALAKKVTGSHMSGRAFFGLTKRRKTR